MILSLRGRRSPTKQSPTYDTEIASPTRRLRLGARNDELQCPAEHHAEDRHDHAEMQK